MKNKVNRLFLILIVIINLTSCATKKAETPSSLDPIHIQNVTNFAKEQFESCMTGKHVPITSDINRRFGDLIEFKIAQTAVYKNTYSIGIKQPILN